jgi:hypothetical protein
MAFTYDPTTNRGLVRLLISDVDVANPLFQDADVDAYLGLASQSVKRAAATALETIASSESLLRQKIKLVDLMLDGPAVATSLREHAKNLRAEAEDEESWTDGGAFDIAEMPIGPFAARERLYNEALREAV